MSDTGWFIVSVYAVYLSMVWLVLWRAAAIVFSLFGAGAALAVLEMEGITNLTGLI